MCWVGLGGGVWFRSLRVMEGLCSREGCPDGLNVYLFSLSGSVLVLSLVNIGRGSGGAGGMFQTMGVLPGRSRRPPLTFAWEDRIDIHASVWGEMDGLALVWRLEGLAMAPGSAESPPLGT